MAGIILKSDAEKMEKIAGQCRLWFLTRLVTAQLYFYFGSKRIQQKARKNMIFIAGSWPTCGMFAKKAWNSCDTFFVVLK
jgi:hypothetical protein